MVDLLKFKCNGGIVVYAFIIYIGLFGRSTQFERRLYRLWSNPCHLDTLSAYINSWQEYNYNLSSSRYMANFKMIDFIIGDNDNRGDLSGIFLCQTGTWGVFSRRNSLLEGSKESHYSFCYSGEWLFEHTNFQVNPESDIIMADISNIYSYIVYYIFISSLQWVSVLFID